MVFIQENETCIMKRIYLYVSSIPGCKCPAVLFQHTRKAKYINIYIKMYICFFIMQYSIYTLVSVTTLSSPKDETLFSRANAL